MLVLILVLSNYSCEEIIEEQDITFENVQLLAPTDGAAIPTNTINLNWEDVEGATAFQVQLAVPDFQTAVQFVLDTVMVQDTLGGINTRISNLNLPNGTYAWRVRGLNSGFSTDYATASFLVIGTNTSSADITP